MKCNATITKCMMELTFPGRRHDVSEVCLGQRGTAQESREPEGLLFPSSTSSMAGIAFSAIRSSPLT